MTAGRGAGHTVPIVHLAVNFLHRFGFVQRGNVIRARNTQHAATAQNIDVPAEGIGIRAIHRHHGLIDVRSRSAGLQTARDLGERIALADPIGVAGDRR